MRRLALVPSVLLALGLAVTLAIASAPASSAPAHRDQPTREVSVAADGLGMYPEFDPATSRYGLTTTDETAGTVTVTATTSDPGGTVRIDGVTATDGTTTLTGLEAGDEISVLFDDAGGSAAYALVYLPAGFPELVRDTSLPDEDPSPGQVLLTLGLWTQPSPFFETAVDANGVPVMVHEEPASMDLKPTGDGGYTVGRPAQEAGQGNDLVELDGAFREVARRHTVGLASMDTHDSILLPDGSAYLLGVRIDRGYFDDVIQQVAADGAVEWEWNSADHVDPESETVLPADDPDNRPTDYAHLNSIQLLPDGDLLASFRHLSSVYKIARTAHDGFAPGDIVWRFGGRHSDFTFTDQDGQPDSGPCAQHTAYQLPNGHILMFDNGAWSLSPLCVPSTTRAGRPSRGRRPESPSGPSTPTPAPPTSCGATRTPTATPSSRARPSAWTTATP